MFGAGTDCSSWSKIEILPAKTCPITWKKFFIHWAKRKFGADCLARNHAEPELNFAKAGARSTVNAVVASALT
jgi:hypothetical protein